MLRLPLSPRPPLSFTSSSLRTYSIASKQRRSLPSSSRPSPSPSAPTPLTASQPLSPLSQIPTAAPPMRNEPPIIASARAKTVKQRNVVESYLVLPAKTRLYFSLALGVVGLVGLWGGDWLVPEEERTEEEKSVRKGVVRV